MFWYILKSSISSPSIGGSAWASSKFAKRMEGKFGQGQGTRSVKIIETQMLSPTSRLAVSEFHGREILVSASKNGLVASAEAPARSASHEPSIDTTA
ncbi:hypothetical protein OY671_008675 [Metschnikowia pulcherrima]|nr:hypothetical protein OY671_008675 [Metschnikowia pulcherrima]